MLEGIFLGYVQQSGGGWSGDVDIVDARDLANALLIEEGHTKSERERNHRNEEKYRSPESEYEQTQIR